MMERWCRRRMEAQDTGFLCIPARRPLLSTVDPSLTWCNLSLNQNCPNYSTRTIRATTSWDSASLWRACQRIKKRCQKFRSFSRASFPFANLIKTKISMRIKKWIWQSESRLPRTSLLGRWKIVVWTPSKVLTQTLARSPKLCFLTLSTCYSHIAGTLLRLWII